MAEGVLRIGELSRRTGLTTDVIRAWERRYGLLRPARSAGNFRLYSIDDLARLRLMQHFMSRGVPAAQAAGLVHRAQTAAVDANPGIPPGEARSAKRVLRESLEGWDEGPAAQILNRLLGLFAPGAVLRDVVLPYLRELGERWACGEATVAQEHFASSFLESFLLGMARGWSRPGRRRAVLACVPGERHTLGLIVFGLALRDLGWRVTYLGADVPPRAIDDAADAVGAGIVVLSSAIPDTFADVAGVLRDLADRRPLALGGAGAGGAEPPWVAGRTLPADPIVAAQALTLDEVGRLARTSAPR
jgi:DNA-binding transcriptional MerR regulator